MNELFSFFIILTASLSFSGLSRFLHVPWIIALIIGGILLGPSAFDMLHLDPITQFLGDIGLIFLMFMAGLETNIQGFVKLRVPIVAISFLNGFIPFLVGLTIALSFGYSVETSVYVAILFISTSISMILGMFQSTGILQTKLGRTLMGVAMLEDLVALLLISLALQHAHSTVAIPPYLMYPLIFGLIILARTYVPRLRNALVSRFEHSDNIYENELRLTLAILFGVVLLFSSLGLEPLVSSFLSGLILAGTITHQALKEKLKTLSYGIFVPAFFIITGLSIDLRELYDVRGGYLFILAVVFGLVTAKFISGYLGTRIFGYKKTESALFGFATLPNLSTLLAMAFVGREAGILDDHIMSAVVVVALTTTLVTPILVRAFTPRKHTLLALEKPRS
ncbi:MAG: cation:proton antiporter [Candidatus Paceibacterota bacterium]